MERIPKIIDCFDTTVRTTVYHVGHGKLGKIMEFQKPKRV